MLYDTHAHLNDEAFAEDAEAALVRALDAGVTKINIVGCDPQMSAKAVEMAEKYDAVYAVVGIHPSDADKYDEAVEEQLRQWAALEKVVAIGEIGLDYHFEDDVDHDIQREVFRRQLCLASELNMPVVIHSRDAMDDTVRIIREEQPEGGFQGVFHCFSGSWEQAKVCLEFGFYIGFDGPLTFKNSRKLPKVASEMPLERLLIETDCPYMAPEPVRGRRNEPAYVKHIAAKVAQLRGISPEDAGRISYENGCRLFGLE
ncbi:MAG: TatD family hydrolase [Clostridia bacterium]